MSALLYIVGKGIKNTVLEILRKPGKLVLYLLTLLLVIGLIVLTAFTSRKQSGNVPMFWLTGGFFLFITRFVIKTVAKSLSGGDMIFEMHEVNLLFTSPISPRKILLYGIIRLVKMAFLAGFFLLFQTSSLANFGVRFGGVLVMLGEFMLSVVVLSVLSLLIYSVSNGNPRRKRAVKIITGMMFLPLVIVIAVNMLPPGDIIGSLEKIIASPALTLIPVAGWTAAGTIAFLGGNLAAGFMYLGANALLGGGIVAYIMLTNPDYYEDTLVATETQYEKKRAIAEGNVDLSAVSGRKIKVSGTGIPGFGPSALFGRHLRESFRQNRFGMLSLMSVLTIIGAVGMGAVVRDTLIVMQILMWMQIFLIGTGRGLKDTYSHYIYMIPASSFSKIIWSNMEVMLRVFVESLLIFIPIGIITKTAVPMVLLCIAAYTLFSFLLLGVNYVSMRFLGTNISMGVMILIYYLMVVIAILPGLVPAIIVGVSIGGNVGVLIGVLILAAWELLAGVILFALAKGVLHACDMPSVKSMG